MVPWSPPSSPLPAQMSSSTHLGIQSPLVWRFRVPHHLVCMTFSLKVEPVRITPDIYDTLLEWKDPREWVQTMKQSVRSESGQPLWVLLSCSQIVWPLGSNIWDQVRVLSCSVMSDSVRHYGLQPIRLLCPWDSPGKNPGVGCHCLLQGVFLTQGLNLGLLLCRRILYHLSHQGSPPFRPYLFAYHRG